MLWLLYPLKPQDIAVEKNKKKIKEKIQKSVDFSVSFWYIN